MNCWKQGVSQKKNLVYCYLMLIRPQQQPKPVFVAFAMNWWKMDFWDIEGHKNSTVYRSHDELLKTRFKLPKKLSVSCYDVDQSLAVNPKQCVSLSRWIDEKWIWNIKGQENILFLTKPFKVWFFLPSLMPGSIILS